MMPDRPPLEFAFLGTGNAFAPKRYWSSFLLNGHLLFDCGPATLAQLKQMGRLPHQIDTIFISHFHADHYLGLPLLLLDYGERSFRTSDITIVGPPGIEAVTEDLFRRSYGGVAAKPSTYGRHYVESGDHAEQRAGGVTFQSFRVQHAEDLECFGYRVRVGDRTIAYTGDSALCDAIFSMAEGAEVLVIDCSQPGGHSPHHLSFDEIVEIRRRIPMSTVMLLTHMEGEQTNGGLEGVVATQDFGHYYFF